MPSSIGGETSSQTDIRKLQPDVANVAKQHFATLVFQGWRAKVRVFKVGETEFKVWKTDFRGSEPELKDFKPQKMAEPLKRGFLVPRRF